MPHGKIDRHGWAGASLLAALLCLPLVACSTESGDDVEWFDCDQTETLRDTRCRAGLDVCYLDSAGAEGCLEIPAACVRPAAEGVDWPCVAGIACPGLPYEAYHEALLCLPVGTTPCPVMEAGGLWYVAACTAGEVCVEACGSSDCTGEGCRPVPAECPAPATCDCLGPVLCAGDPYSCTDETEFSHRIVTCNPL